MAGFRSALRGPRSKNSVRTSRPLGRSTRQTSLSTCLDLLLADADAGDPGTGALHDLQARPAHPAAEVEDMGVGVHLEALDDDVGEPYGRFLVRSVDDLELHAREGLAQALVHPEAEGQVAAGVAPEVQPLGVAAEGVGVAAADVVGHDDALADAPGPGFRAPRPRRG